MHEIYERCYKQTPSLQVFFFYTLEMVTGRLLTKHVNNKR